MKLTPTATTLDERVVTLLEEQTPNTADRDALNVQSQRQLRDATYRIDEELARVSDANHLVPEAVSQDNQEGTWRYPPHMEASVLVRRESLNEGSLNITGGFHRARFLTYHETRQNYTGPITSSPDIDIPSAFASMEFGEDTVSLVSRGDDGTAYLDKSAPLDAYEFSLDPIDLDTLANGDGVERQAALNESSAPVKLYEESTDRTTEATIDEEGTVTQEVDLSKVLNDSHARAAFLKLEQGPIDFSVVVTAEETAAYPDHVRIRVRLVNHGAGQIERRRYRLQEKSQSLFNPHLELSFENADLMFPSQQHADAIEDAVEGTDDVRRKDREGIEAVYSQVNGTLTQSTVDSSRFVLAPYGVYDYLQEVPCEAYSVETLTESVDVLGEHLDGLTDEERDAVRETDGLLELARDVLEAVPDGFDLSRSDSLYAFQWQAIQRRLALLATGQQETTVLKAPTGAGKTLPFLVNAALTALHQDTRVVLAFPTRLLNEDMSKRVMRFTAALRTSLNRDDLSAGLLVGQSDPLYGKLSDIQVGDSLAQYDRCPSCGEQGEIVGAKPNHRIIGHCEACGHDIDYVYHPREAISYLPTFTVATPDKLFYEATVRGYETQPYGKLPFFGGTYLPCDSCDAVASVMSPHPDQDTVTCPECKRDIPLQEENFEHSPIGHWVFDEVHSLHDLTGTLLSIFLELPNLMYSKIQDVDYHADGYTHEPTFETGTATIANEIELLSAVTRTPRDEIRPIPKTEDYNDFFEVDTDATRYRVLAMLPVGTSNRQSVRRALIAAHDATHNDDTYRETLQDALDDAGRGADLSAYEFLLGYVYKKSDGRSLQTSISDQSAGTSGDTLNPPFLSGNTSTEEMSELFTRAQEGDLPVLLANLVISLGVDIDKLNQMIMLGAPKQMTEQVQTAGRTGRGAASGHVSIHLLPSNPRDVYLYGNFHRVMSDVEGYYESYPIQSTNAHAAELLLPNLVKALLATQSYEQFALTTNKAAQALSDRARRDELEADLLRLLRTPDTDDALVREIYDTIRRTLDTYAHEWGRLDDSPYLSSWFQEQSDIMYSLRKSTGRRVDVTIENDSVLNQIQQDYTVTTN